MKFGQVIQPSIVGVSCIVLLSADVGMAHADQTAPPQPLTIGVDIRDYAEIPSWRWRGARREIDRMMAGIDLRVVWSGQITSTPTAAFSGVPHVTVLLLSAEMVEAKCKTDGLARQILGSGDERVGRAWIFYDRIVATATASGVTPADLLARTIVHELGHAIAGLSHTEFGIMRAYAELIPTSYQKFLPSQVKAMRNAIVKRQYELPSRRASR